MAATARSIRRADHGRRINYDDFVASDFEEGCVFELRRGVIAATDVPDIGRGMIVMRLAEMFCLYGRDHPGVIHYQSGRGYCCVRLPGAQSCLRPNQAIYLSPPPRDRDPWAHWPPAIAVEFLGGATDEVNPVERREDYLRAGVVEYWTLAESHPGEALIVSRRAGDIWTSVIVPEDGAYRTDLLPGLEVRPADLIRPAGGL